jgi:hypothetical protein
MALSPKLRKLIEQRDGHCYHCGTTEGLQVHHRKNRGMGGSKLLDTPDNLIQVCAAWNFYMESDAEMASTARGWNHKLPVWESLELLFLTGQSFGGIFCLLMGVRWSLTGKTRRSE